MRTALAEFGSMWSHIAIESFDWHLPMHQSIFACSNVAKSCQLCTNLARQQMHLLVRTLFDANELATLESMRSICMRSCSHVLSTPSAQNPGGDSGGDKYIVT